MKKSGTADRRPKARPENRRARDLLPDRAQELVEIALQRGTLKEFGAKLDALKARASQTSDPVAQETVRAFHELLHGNESAGWPGLHRFSRRMSGKTTIVRTPLAKPNVVDAIIDRLEETGVELRDDGLLTALGLVARKASATTDGTHIVGFRSGDSLCVRQAAVADLAFQSVLEEEVDAALVDGEPLVSEACPPAKLRRLRRVRRVAQRSFDFVGPKTLDGRQVKDIVITALNDLSIEDESSPLRTDISRLSTLAFALSKATVLTEEQGARFLGGRASRGNIRRFWNAAHTLRGMTVVLDLHGRWFDLAIVSANPFDKTVYLAPPWWWSGKGAGQAWRPSGALFRPAIYPDGVGSGLGADTGYWPGLFRTLAGFEARLSWGPSAGRGRGGRIPDALRPVRKGGPGDGVWVPWRSVLSLSGEPVPEDADANSKHARRYRRRIAALEQAGYRVGSPSDTARAEDTVEVVKVVPGRRSQPAGLVIRPPESSARPSQAGNGNGGPSIGSSSTGAARRRDPGSPDPFPKKQWSSAKGPRLVRLTRNGRPPKAQGSSA